MTTPKSRPPAPVAGALVPPLPDEVRQALAAIGGEPFAAAMASRVWPLACTLMEDFQAAPSAEQKRAWLERAAENFRAAARGDPAADHGGLHYIASMPDELLLLRRWPGPDAPPAEWEQAIRSALGHPGVLRSASKGPTKEAVEIARAMLPAFAAAEIKVTLYERGPAVAALQCIGNAASAVVGLKPCRAWRWRMALKEALPARQ